MVPGPLKYVSFLCGVFLSASCGRRLGVIMSSRMTFFIGMGWKLGGVFVVSTLLMMENVASMFLKSLRNFSVSCGVSLSLEIVATWCISSFVICMGLYEGENLLKVSKWRCFIVAES